MLRKLADAAPINISVASDAATRNYERINIRCETPQAVHRAISCLLENSHFVLTGPHEQTGEYDLIILSLYAPRNTERRSLPPKKRPRHSHRVDREEYED